MQYPYHSTKCASQCPSGTGLRKPLGHVDVILTDLISNNGCYTSRSDLQHMDVVLPRLWTLEARYIVLALRGQYWLKTEGRQNKFPNPYRIGAATLISSWMEPNLSVRTACSPDPWKWSCLLREHDNGAQILANVNVTLQDEESVVESAGLFIK